jgi:glycosyltransferase involved in cell wall biosynthesis
MRACRAVNGLSFEGGFAPRRRTDVEGISDVLARRMYPFREWIRLTKSSALVFNCPAVHGCLGWKLGEFMALGKAMVSLPLSREMPSPLVHGEHVHYVEDDEASIKAGIEQLLGDDPYRTKLEIAARKYYLDYLAPERVIERLAFDS